MALKQVGNIFCNGDKEDYSRSEKPCIEQSVVEELFPFVAVPASACHVRDGIMPELSNRVLNFSLHRKHMAAHPSLPFVGFSARSVRSILVPARVRLPQRYDYSNWGRCSINRGIGLRGAS